MDSNSVLNLIESLSTLHKEGISEWNGCILSKEIIVSSKLNSAAAKTQLTNTIFANVTDIENAQFQTYMWKTAHLKTSSVSWTPTHIDSDGSSKLLECFDGSPLQLEDHIGDVLLADSMDTTGTCESVLFDQTCLVPDEIFTYMMSCLCTAFTSYNFDNIPDWQMLLKSIFPMVVFWETSNIGDDRNGMIFVEYPSAISSFCLKRIKVLGQFPYNMWCGATQHHLNTINFMKNKHLDESICASSTVKMESYAQFERLQANERSIKDVGSSFAAVSVACDQVGKLRQFRSVQFNYV